MTDYLTFLCTLTNLYSHCHDCSLSILTVHLKVCLRAYVLVSLLSGLPQISLCVSQEVLQNYIIRDKPVPVLAASGSEPQSECTSAL